MTDSKNAASQPAIFPSTAIALMVVGWSGLIALILGTEPNLGPRWLFFFFGMLALTGTALPLIAFIHYRFPSDPPPGANVILRQAMWVGGFGLTLVWLQLGRTLSLSVAIFLAFGFIGIEAALRLYERSRWEP